MALFMFAIDRLPSSFQYARRGQTLIAFFWPNIKKHCMYYKLFLDYDLYSQTQSTNCQEWLFMRV
jgi:hypothetical protein